MQLRKEWILPASIGIVSFAAGSVAGYIYAKRRNIVSVVTVVEEGDVELKTEEQIEHEQILQAYDAVFDPKVIIDESELRDPIAEQQAIEETLREERDLEERAKIKEAQAMGPGQFNIFEGRDDEWNYDVEVPLRTAEKPYIIHREEFEANETDNSQSSLSYYALDDILCDEHDVPIYDYQKIVGVLEFGKGSEDISICYVRNEKLGADWEIILDQGSFQVQVLGEKVEEAYEEGDIKHSRHPRKFRENE